VSKFTIVCDTREQLPIVWRESQAVAGTLRKKLDVGDYSILGMEDVLAIERKGTCQEFAHNILEDRFYRELERLNLYKYAFLILEFSMDEMEAYPFKTKLPKSVVRKIRVRGKFLLKKLVEIECKYPNIQVIFSEYGAKDLIEKICQNIAKK